MLFGGVYHSAPCAWCFYASYHLSSISSLLPLAAHHCKFQLPNYGSAARHCPFSPQTSMKRWDMSKSGPFCRVFNAVNMEHINTPCPKQGRETIPASRQSWHKFHFDLH